MKRGLLAIVLLWAAPALADDASHYVTGWLERCFAHADHLEEENAHLIRRDVDFRSLSREEKIAKHNTEIAPYLCKTGAITICEHDIAEEVCLSHATRWMDEQGSAVLQSLPENPPLNPMSKLDYLRFMQSGGTVLRWGSGECTADRMRTMRFGAVPWKDIQCEAFAAGQRLLQLRIWRQEIDEKRTTP